MVGKLARLPQETRDALQWLAALGAAADFVTLGLVLERPVEAVHTALGEAVRAGLVLRQDRAYAFLHDRVQEAAYSLIPQPKRAGAHLRIGRIMSSSLPPDQIADRAFDVVNQLNRGATLVEAAEERERIAELNLLAGGRAKTSTAFAAALTYFAAGSAMLANDRWARRYGLAFALELNRAECEFLTGDLEAADHRLAPLGALAADTVDRAAVTCLHLAVYMTMDRSDLAVETCLDYLRQVGIDWTSDPADDEVRKEYDALWARIGDRPIESLIDLPRMSDPEKRATLQVLIAVQAQAMVTDPNLFALVVGRAANLSLEYGNDEASPFAYALLGMVLGPHFEKYRSTSRFGSLALALLETRDSITFRAEVYQILSQTVPWSRPIREAMELVRRAFAASQEAGNLNFAAYARTCRISDEIFAGDHLAEVQEASEQAWDFVQKTKFGLVAEVIATQVRFVRTLRGLTRTFGSFSEADFDQGRFEARLESDYPPIGLFWYRVRKLQALVFSGDFVAASADAVKAQAVAWASPGFIEVAEYHFYAALACAGRCTVAPEDERRECLAALRVHHDKLATWAANCPANFADRAALVAAEIARIEGRELEAMRLYEEAIRSAHDNGFVHNEALANEWASRFYFDRGFDKSGLAYLRDARAGYALWGAEGKVRQLDELYPQLAALEPAAAAGSVVGQLDATTLIKAYQAVSGEIDLPRLVETLMTITLQNAGADHGLLLLPREDRFLIEAEARAAGAGVEVQLRRAAMTVEDGPQDVVNLVIRTRERALLEDGSRPGPAWETAFGTSAPPRSAFCLPLLRQGRLAGVLYLENSQAAYAFTAKRVAVLEALAAQAAIALENARLYGDLQAREAKIRRLVEANIIGIFVWKLGGRIIEANDAFLALVGYDRQDLRSGRIPGRSDMTPPEWRDVDRRADDRILAEGIAPPYEKEYLRKDGGRVRVLVGRAGFDDTREEGVAFVLDLTEQKAAEQRLKLMVDELNHRVKNTLATVMSVSAQSLRTAASLEGFKEAFQQRLQALSNTHNLLNQTFWTGVSLGDLVQQATAPYAIGEADRVVIEGEDVRLGPIAAVTLGMALHELATNATRYGAFSTASGRVRVAWLRSEPGRLSLVWEESGGPPVKPPSRRGFGSKLIEKVLAAELRGEVRLEFPPQGVRCTMDMALERVSAH
jgi:PAS domain S-box-containing protein